MEEIEDQLESLKQHILDSGRQIWLFGAGISQDANIPLMYPLTQRVKDMLQDQASQENKDILAALEGELPESSHIEHYLSHLGDLIALSERARNKDAILADKKYGYQTLVDCHRAIVSAIGDTVRYGYKSENEIGTLSNPIVDIQGHLRFVRALYKNKANLEKRSSISFFTTNYDTLLEDALVLNQVNVIDGFSGGAMGYWNGEHEFSQVPKYLTCALYKLHGSVDWHQDGEHGLVRVRYGAKYTSNTSDIMIYPQATKYVETQKDPFATLFSQMRSILKSNSQNVLITCGYSFGDEHINSEIEACLRHDENRTTVIAFTDERRDDQWLINPTLDKWLQDERFRQRIFVAGKKGLYHGSTEPTKIQIDDLRWWTFSGLVEFLESSGAVK